MKELLEKINNNIAELTADIQEIESDFHERTEPYRNQKYGKSEFLEKYSDKSYFFNLNMFEGKSKLLIPSIVDDYGTRPQSGIDYNSTGIQILKGNAPINKIDSSGKYTVQCKVQNAGDLSVPIANVEFFVGPKYKSNDLDIKVNKVVMTPKRISGRMSLKIEVRGEVKKGSLQVLQHVYLIAEGRVVGARVTKLFIERNGQYVTANSTNEGDQVALDLDVSIENATFLRNVYQIIADTSIESSDLKDFRLKIQDVFSITGRGTVVTGKVEQGMVEVGDTLTLYREGVKQTNLTLTITGFEGFRRTLDQASTGMEVGMLFRGVSKDNFKKGDLLIKVSNPVNRNANPPKSDNLSDFELLGKVAIDVPALGSTLAEFEFDAEKIGAKGKIFACRVYSLMPIDMPEDFDSLDAKINRHVGLLEIN